MRNKSKTTTAAERDHVQWVKSQACIVCDKPGPSIAHHIRQESHFYTVPLCEDCHTGDHNGIHRSKCMWKVMKMDEMDALAKLVQLMHSR